MIFDELLRHISPYNLLDLISVTVLLVSYSGLLVAWFFKGSTELKIIFLSAVLGLAPALLLMTLFSPFYNELTMFLIYYPCFWLIFWSIIPWVVNLLQKRDTHTHTDITSHTEDLSGSDSETLQDRYESSNPDKSLAKEEREGEKINEK